jgi:DNA mismatch endonuclease, patch repair protein
MILWLSRALAARCPIWGAEFTDSCLHDHRPGPSAACCVLGRASGAAPELRRRGRERRVSPHIRICGMTPAHSAHSTATGRVLNPEELQIGKSAEPATLRLMSDVVSRARRSQIMAAIRSKGNKATELKLVSILRAAGITGWRRHKPVLGRPDFVFPNHRLAIFVDGCFWHGCRSHCRMPQDNRQYWKRKIQGNALRDAQTNRLLRAHGWRILRIWSHSLGEPEIVVDRITSALSASLRECKTTCRIHERSR